MVSPRYIFTARILADFQVYGAVLVGTFFFMIAAPVRIRYSNLLLGPVYMTGGCPG